MDCFFSTWIHKFSKIGNTELLTSWMSCIMLYSFRLLVLSKQIIKSLEKNHEISSSYYFIWVLRFVEISLLILDVSIKAIDES